MSDPNAVTWWIVVLTILVGIQSVALAVLAVKVMQFVRRTQSTMDAVDRSLAPVVTEAQHLMSDVRALRHTVQRAEQGLSVAIDRVTTATSVVKGALRRRFWPVLGTVAAGRAVLQTISARRQSSRRHREDEFAIARFADEGGSHYDSR